MANKLGSLLIQIGANTALLQRDMGKAVGIMNASSQRMNQALNSTRNLLGSIGAGVSFAGVTRSFVEAADVYTRMSGQLRLVTANSDELAAVQERLFALAQNTRSAFEPTVQLYTRMARNAETLGASQEELLKVTETFNKALQISGSTGQEAAAASLQFSQSLSSGNLAGQELLSILENGPRAAKALLEGIQEIGAGADPALGPLIDALKKIGDGAKLTLGDLRNMGADRALPSIGVFRAFLTQFAKVNGEFEKLPRTVGQSMTQLSNEIQRAMGTSDMAPLIEGIDEFKKALGDPQTLKAIAAFGGAIAAVINQAVRDITRLHSILKGLANTFGLFQSETQKITSEMDALRAKQGGIVKALEIKGTSASRDAAIAELNAINSRLLTLQANLAKAESGNKKAGVDLTKKPPQPTPRPVDPDKPDTAAISAEKARVASIKSIIDGLKEQQAAIGKNESALVAYKLQVLGATKAQVDFAVSLSQANAIQEIIDGLEQEGAVLGLTGEALLEYQLRLQGANQAQIDLATTISRKNTAKQNDLDAIEKEAAARETLAERIQQINEEVIWGLMDEVTAIRTAEAQKVADVMEGLEKRVKMERDAAEIIADIHKKADQEVAEVTKKKTSELGEFALEAARSIQNTLGDQLFNVLQGNFENIGAQFKATLDRMVADALAAQLAKKLFGDFDKTGSVGGIIGSIFGAISGTKVPARADGGPAQAGAAYLVGEKEQELFIPQAMRTPRMRGMPPTPQPSKTEPYMIGVKEAEIFRPKVSGMIVAAKDFAKYRDKLAGAQKGAMKHGTRNTRLPAVGMSRAAYATPDMFRANGGWAAAGNSYIVGERSPERFIPAMDDKMQPRQESGPIIQHFNVSGITDARGIREASAQLAARAATAAERARARNR